jgi:transcriptional regulator with XRE-family HTH domain
MQKILSQTAATKRPWARSVLMEMALQDRAAGQRLAQARKQKRLTQEGAAQKIGVSVRTYSDWERGISLPRPSNLTEIERVLEVDTRAVYFENPAQNGLPSERLDRIEDKLDRVLRHFGETEMTAEDVSPEGAEHELEDVAPTDGAPDPPRDSPTRLRPRTSK